MEDADSEDMTGPKMSGLGLDPTLLSLIEFVACTSVSYNSGMYGERGAWENSAKSRFLFVEVFFIGLEELLNRSKFLDKIG